MASIVGNSWGLASPPRGRSVATPFSPLNHTPQRAAMPCAGAGGGCGGPTVEAPLWEGPLCMGCTGGAACREGPCSAHQAGSCARRVAGLHASGGPPGRLPPTTTPAARPLIYAVSTSTRTQPSPRTAGPHGRTACAPGPIGRARPDWPGNRLCWTSASTLDTSSHGRLLQHRAGNGHGKARIRLAPHLHAAPHNVSISKNSL